MKKLISILSLWVLGVSFAGATLPFKSQSVLASGRWVKLKVDKTGIYELSYDELKARGFSNPENVKVFGEGGNVASESFSDAFVDDLEQVPAWRNGGKIYFYGKGPVREAVTVATDTLATIYVTPVQNPYSQAGFYFLTEDGNEPVRAIGQTAAPTQEDMAKVGKWHDSSIATWIHEKESINIGQTGKVFLGENLLQTNGGISFNVPVPLAKSGSLFYGNARTAIFSTGKSELQLSIDEKPLELKMGNTLSANTSTEYLEYGLLRTHGCIKYDAKNGHVLFHVATTSEGRMVRSFLDYATLSYEAVNSLPADSAQAERFVVLKSETEGIRLSSVVDGTQVWMVEDSGNMPGFSPVSYALAAVDGGRKAFVPKEVSSYAKFVFFNPALEQLHPAFVGEVAAQNLHAMEVPDMLVITNAQMSVQAERLAQFHREHDGMKVAVVDQNLIFNEFSSGRRDAMAYRRICKMLYDRNSERFKYLLLFGSGTFDNRMLAIGGSKSDMLLTFQSEESTSQVKSYSTDDFFALLTDNSTQSLAGKKLQIAVGRIPFTVESDAKAYVDKVIKYSTGKTENSLSSWRSNMLVVGENGDDYAHVDACETFLRNFNAQSNYDMNVSKIYLQAYGDQSVINGEFRDYLRNGQNVVMMVVHGNTHSVTRQLQLMNRQSVEGYDYPYWPIMYISSCDVVRFDNGSSMFGTPLLANPGGGVIALLSSTRTAYTNLNGKLSDSFGRSLGKVDAYYGGEKTIGRVMLDAKNTSTDMSINRLKYHVIGDPALPVRLPEKKAILSKLNGKAPSDTVEVERMQKVALEIAVTDAEGAVDTGFNGVAVVKFFNGKQAYTTSKVTETGGRPLTPVYNRGAELAGWNYQVKDGILQGSVVVPQVAADGAAELRVQATSEDGAIVSGSYGNLVVQRTDAGGADIVPDTEAPEISAFYINSEAFSDGDILESPDITVYAEVSDKSGISTSSETLGTHATLIIDGGKQSIPASGQYYPAENGRGRFVIPVYGLAEGRHSVELTVSDVAGNCVRHAAVFIIGTPEAEEESLQVNKKYVADKVEISGESTLLPMELYVSDKDGDVLLRTTVKKFPYEWNGSDAKGQRLAPGVYSLHGVYAGSKGTKSEKIVVVKQ